MEAHPAANIFPMLSDGEMAELAANIKEHGQREPIVLHEGQILDGRNRWRACELAGVTPRTRAWDGECGSPTRYVLAMNILRRHLNESQRAAAGAMSLPLLKAEAAARQQAGRVTGGPLGAEFGRMGGRGHKKEETPCAPIGAQGVSEPSVVIAVSPLPPSEPSPSPSAQIAASAVLDRPSPVIVPSPTQHPKPKRKPEHKAATDAAKIVQASARSVERANRVQAKSPELIKQVVAGDITLGAAEQRLREAEKREQAAALVATVAATDPSLHIADATQPWPVAVGTVDLIFTSPPYGLDKPYRGTDDLASAWPVFMADWLQHAYTAAADTGRLVLNVPLDTTKGGYRPTWPQACDAAIAAGWTYRTCLLWEKSASTKGNRGLGSLDSADAPHPIAEVEVLGLFSKGAWKKAVARPSDISHDEWQEWGNGLWKFSGETHPWEGHPAPFPEELARRVLLYLSRVGDLVVDPFVGSGTTAMMARRLKREIVGLDQSAAYIASAHRRLAQQKERAAHETASETQLGFDVPAGTSE